MRWIRSGESTRGLTEEENGGCLEELARTEREHSVCGVSVWVLFGELRKRVAGARICGGVVQCNEVPPGALVTGNPTRYLVCTWYGTCTGIVPVSQVSRYQVGLNNSLTVHMKYCVHVFFKNYITLLASTCRLKERKNQIYICCMYVRKI